MKTAVSLPDPLFEAADRLAQKLGISRSQLYQRALADYLNSHGRDAVTEALDLVYGPDGPDGPNGDRSALDPAVEWMQGASIAAESAAEDW